MNQLPASDVLLGAILAIAAIYAGTGVYHCYLLGQLKDSLERTEGLLKTIAIVLSMREGQLSDRQLFALFKMKQDESPEDSPKPSIHFPKEPRGE